MSNVLRWPAAASTRAPKAESRSTPGPLTPWRVRSSGPRARIFVSRRLRQTSFTLTPERAASAGASSRRPKSEGQGASTAWPSASHGASASGRERPPQVTATWSKCASATGAPCRSTRRNVPSGAGSTVCTSLCVRHSTPPRCKAESSASTTVADCCEAGKTRPSASTRSATPSDSHRAMRRSGRVARSRRLISRAPRG